LPGSDHHQPVGFINGMYANDAMGSAWFENLNQRVADLAGISQGAHDIDV
jgi:hypothetical protein